jgi:hypothetical protein
MILRDRQGKNFQTALVPIPANSCNFEGWNTTNAWPNIETQETKGCGSNFID